MSQLMDDIYLEFILVVEVLIVVLITLITFVFWLWTCPLILTSTYGSLLPPISAAFSPLASIAGNIEERKQISLQDQTDAFQIKKELGKEERRGQYIPLRTSFGLFSS